MPKAPIDAVEVLVRLQRVRDERITATEKDAVDACMDAVRDLLGER